jgi:hypothetical protein
MSIMLCSFLEQFSQEEAKIPGRWTHGFALLGTLGSNGSKNNSKFLVQRRLEKPSEICVMAYQIRHI